MSFLQICFGCFIGLLIFLLVMLSHVFVFKDKKINFVVNCLRFSIIFFDCIIMNGLIEHLNF